MATFTLTPTLTFDSVSGQYLISEDTLGISANGAHIQAVIQQLITLAQAIVPGNYQIVISQPQTTPETYGEPGGP